MFRTRHESRREIMENYGSEHKKHVLSHAAGELPLQELGMSERISTFAYKLQGF